MRFRLQSEDHLRLDLARDTIARRRGDRIGAPAASRCDTANVKKHQAGDFDDEVETGNLLQRYEARIAALERLVGKQALELEFLKGAQKVHPGREAGVRPS
jgi:hypothetical protein